MPIEVNILAKDGRTIKNQMVEDGKEHQFVFGANEIQPGSMAHIFARQPLEAGITKLTVGVKAIGEKPTAAGTK